MRTAIVLAAGLILAGPALSADPAKITWKKTVIDTRFRAEGVAVADVNKDGKMDIIVGEIWYENPTWTIHEMQKPGDYGDGLKNYSKVFAVWADDINGDGWQDVIVIDFPGAPCYWLENPQNKEGHWKKHIIWHSACNETPLYVDLLGNGKRVLVMGFQPKGKDNEGQMAYFTPGKDPTQVWEMHPISEPSTPPQLKDGKPVPNTGKIIPGTFRFSHGLGVGDLNGDGRQDVICTGGWWEQPSKVEDKPWTFHPAGLGDACADMYVVDMDGDGKMDVISSSAHKFGIWSYLQKPGKGEHPSFLKQDLFKDLVSETHAMHFADIDGDGVKDMVTGKRWWSHGKSEPGSDKPSMLYWFQGKKASDGTMSFTPIPIDDASGIGTQFTVTDFNGDKLLDVITANKRGVFLFEQVRK